MELTHLGSKASNSNLKFHTINLHKEMILQLIQLIKQKEKKNIYNLLIQLRLFIRRNKLYNY